MVFCFSPQVNEWKIQVVVCTLHAPLFLCLHPFPLPAVCSTVLVSICSGALRSRHGCIHLLVLLVATWFFMVDLHHIPYGCCLDLGGWVQHMRAITFAVSAPYFHHVLPLLLPFLFHFICLAWGMCRILIGSKHKMPWNWSLSDGIFDLLQVLHEDGDWCRLLWWKLGTLKLLRNIEYLAI